MSIRLDDNKFALSRRLMPRQREEESQARLSDPNAVSSYPPATLGRDRAPISLVWNPQQSLLFA